MATTSNSLQSGPLVQTGHGHASCEREQHILKLFQLHMKVGNKWSLIAAHLDVINRGKAKNDFYCYIRNLARKIVAKEVSMSEIESHAKLQNYFYAIKIMKKTLENQNSNQSKKGGYKIKDTYLKKSLKKLKISLPMVNQFENQILTVQFPALQNKISCYNNNPAPIPPLTPNLPPITTEENSNNGSSIPIVESNNLESLPHLPSISPYLNPTGNQVKVQQKRQDNFGSIVRANRMFIPYPLFIIPIVLGDSSLHMNNL